MKILMNLVADLSKPHVVAKHIIDARLSGLERYAQMQGRVGLGIQVQNAYAMTARGDACSEIHCSGRFTNPTFLIDDCNFSHTKPMLQTSD
jgi:UDP-N-acetylenolpyruvoylglucosamine reductase